MITFLARITEILSTTPKGEQIAAIRQFVDAYEAAKRDGTKCPACGETRCPTDGPGVS